jgi:osmotically inducible protein OsmC
MAEKYKARVTSRGGRNGHVTSDDGLLDFPVSVPTTLGGRGDATNPEQLFAAGYAACFGNAVIHLAKSEGLSIQEEDVEVTAEVALAPSSTGAFSLRISLEVSIAGADHDVTQALTERAHQICPYSNATRNNVDVELAVR